MAKHSLLVTALLGILAPAAQAQFGAPPGSEPLAANGAFGPPACAAPAPPAAPAPALELTLPSYDPNAFFGNCPEQQPCRPTFWVDADGLLGWIPRGRLGVPLITGSTAPNPNSNVGAIGESNTFVAFGNGGLEAGVLGGARVTAGLDFQDRVWWLLPFEFSGFYLTSKTHSFAPGSDRHGNPLIARPIFAAQPGVTTETVYLSSFPGLAAGSVDVSYKSSLWGMEFDAVGYSGLISHVDGNLTYLSFVAGIRYINFGEDLEVASTATPLSSQFGLFFNGNTLGPGNTTLVQDSFQTRNYFVGPQVGARVNWQSGPWFVNVAGKIAIGNMEEVVNINGFSTLKDINGGLFSAPGGVLAVASNSGQFQRDQFAYVPEGMLTLGLEINNNWRVQVGYDLMYLNTVVRPGDQVNRNVDTRQIPTDFAFDPTVTGTSPGRPFKQTDLWMQSFSIGVTFSY